MSLLRIPLAFMIGGVVFKSLLILLFELSHNTYLGAAIYYDPGGIWFAFKAVSLFFDPRRLEIRMVMAWELFLVIGFGLECFLVGLIARWFLGRMMPRRGNP